ncbi:hypothetical protein C8R48DRAFT_768800 [Suillus tomentosus]|nr:hypothetical protein C8R48DRAFT_768800 [Suillus tomentosus]
MAAARGAANAQLSDSTYYNRESIPSEPVTPVSAVEKRREHDEFRKHKAAEETDKMKLDEDAGGPNKKVFLNMESGSQHPSFVDPHFYEDVTPLLMPIESSTRNRATTLTSLKPRVSPRHYRAYIIVTSARLILHQ